MNRRLAPVVIFMIVLIMVMLMWSGGWFKGDSSPKTMPAPSPTASSTSAASEPSSEPTPFGESVASPSASSGGKCENQSAITEQLDAWQIFESSRAYIQDGGGINYRQAARIAKANLKYGFSSQPLIDRETVGLFAKRPEGRSHKGNVHMKGNLSSDNFYPIQFEVEASYNGVYIWKNGKATWDESMRTVMPGEVWWFYVNSQCEVVTDNTVHADGTIGVANMSP